MCNVWRKQKPRKLVKTHVKTMRKNHRKTNATDHENACEGIVEKSKKPGPATTSQKAKANPEAVVNSVSFKVLAEAISTA